MTKAVRETWDGVVPDSYLVSSLVNYYGG